MIQQNSECTQKRIAACKLGPVITHEGVKKEKTEQNIGASNVIKTQLGKKKVLFYNYFINNNLDFLNYYYYSWDNSWGFQRCQWELCMILRCDANILN